MKTPLSPKVVYRGSTVLQTLLRPVDGDLPPSFLHPSLCPFNPTDPLPLVTHSFSNIPMEQIDPLLTEMKRIADARRVSVSAIAINWVLSKGERRSLSLQTPFLFRADFSFSFSRYVFTGAIPLGEPHFLLLSAHQTNADPTIASGSRVPRRIQERSSGETGLSPSSLL